jgi:3-hydroxybutyryl-CoA dehydrogenase
MEYYRDSKDPRDKPPDELKAMIERGELGVKSGRGFYDWKGPDFATPGFLKPN